MAERPTADVLMPLAGRYELGDLLGAGGMADVYRARDTLLGREVAVKVFRTAVADEQFDARQRGEITLLAALNHPGLVTIFDAGTGRFADCSHRAFLVMELVTGPSLAGRLSVGTLPAAETALVGAQVAEALGYIHAAAVVHRDVKPANILLPGADVAGPTQAWTKLTDFGIARLVDDAHLTSTGLLLGTPGYLSPEQATGSSPGPLTDVYALGLVLLECRTGVRSFPGSAIESATARLHRDPDVPTDLGGQWTDLLRAMTSRQPEDRPTAFEASTDLRELIDDRARTRVLAAMPAVPAVPADDATQALATSAPDGATQVLAVPLPGRTASGRPTSGRPASERPGSRRPTSGRPARWRQRPVQIAAGVLVAAAAGGALWVGTRDAGPGPQVPPTYPAVSGQLGEHLEQLQTSVQP
ncbi:serine/threonine-protein kinase [Pengzhenrongella sicca]|uniref:non-specific serine/threonine protein kinase n=1 Tax=Pengzhenrongella sicca TaxID=2819238 RepID=A0A8A4ZFI2_9MICO|nr:serine/threonine-protein kinase [Pengzhenrongella sicca]QTE28438.1 serine/threonine protein kinase [Pengzhenrongella sicca]